MVRTETAPIEASLLIWARKTIHYDLQEAAKKIGVSVEKLEQWEIGESKPTVAQLKQIANVYKRPLAVFFLPRPPHEYERPFAALNLRDFRRLPESETSRFSSALILELRKAENRRLLIIDLLKQLGHDIPEFELIESNNNSPEVIAERIRLGLGVTFEEQSRWRDSNLALRNWIHALEHVGVLVFQTGFFQGNLVSVSEMRGIAINFSNLPIIIMNGSDSPTARIFTLMHEFCHLLLNISGISDVFFDLTSDISNSEGIEIFCNRFAAEMLIPMRHFREEINRYES